MTPARPGGIIFDLDGTLYRMRWYLRPLIFAQVLPHGLLLPAFLKVRDGFSGTDMGDREQLMAAVCMRLAEQRHRDPDWVRAWIDGTFYPAFVKAMPFFRGSRPGLVHTLRHLRSRGFRLGVLSDYTMVDRRLEGLGISRDLFDSVAAAEDMGALKPCARPFLHVAHRWGLDAGSVLVVGDRADTDGGGAGAAGMQFLQVAGTRQNLATAKPWDDAKAFLLSL